MSLRNFKKIVDESAGKVFQCLEESEIVLYKKNINQDPKITCIKDVEVGGYVYNGKDYVRIYSLNKKTVDKFIRIKTVGGRVIDCSLNHKFPVNDMNNIKEAKEIKVGDKLFYASKFQNKEIEHIDLVKLIIEKRLDYKIFISGLEDLCSQHNIKMTPNKTIRLDRVKHLLVDFDYSLCKLNFERSNIKFKAKLEINELFLIQLGHYIANGSKRSYVMHVNKEKMCEKITQSLDINFREFKYVKKVQGNKIVVELNSYILHKFIFDELLECRYKKSKQLPYFLINLEDEEKKYFLRGYFSDGNVSIKTKNISDGNYGAIIFNTSSNKLYKDMCLLLASMSISYCVNSAKKNISYYKKENRFIKRKRRFRIKISNKIDISKIHEVVSDHNRYNDLLSIKNIGNIKYTLGSLKDKRVIKKIEIIDKEINVVDINIDSSDRLFVTSNGIISHNCALGGRGDVDQHENFLEIVQYCRKNNIVPNFTSSGLGFTEEIVQICKEYCGAVAISWYRQEHTLKAIDMLLKADVKTNIHYVLGDNSIDEAINRLENNDFPKGINAIIFLLHKPVGLGRKDNVLSINDERVKKFFNIIDNKQFDFKVGFDSCTVPALINLTSNLNKDSFDTCEAARWSMYITSDMKALPCSFDNQDLRWAYDISNDTIKDAWDSQQFDDFRNYFKKSCVNCKDNVICYGGCPIKRSIVLCNRKEKDLYEVQG